MDRMNGDSVVGRETLNFRSIAWNFLVLVSHCLRRGVLCSFIPLPFRNDIQRPQAHCLCLFLFTACGQGRQRTFTIPRNIRKQIDRSNDTHPLGVNGTYQTANAIDAGIHTAHVCRTMPTRCSMNMTRFKKRKEKTWKMPFGFLLL